MMKSKRIVLMMTAAFAAVALLSSIALASKQDLMSIAVDSLVSGWSVSKESTIYVGADKLPDIYDGGYEVYTKAGVLEAVRKLYMRGNESVEVTVHTMKSVEAAKAFLAARHKMELSKDAPKTAGWNRFTVSGSGSTTGYAVQGRIFIVVVSNYEGEKGKQQAAEFLKPLEANAVKIAAKK
jgi:hypothetical protein